MSKKREYTGYAVVSKDFKACSFTDYSLETCKQYLRKDSVIVRTYRKTIGYRLEFGVWTTFVPFYFSTFYKSIYFLWFSLKWEKVRDDAWEKGKDKIVCRYEDLKKEE